jgi:hypothetical protein
VFWCFEFGDAIYNCKPLAQSPNPAPPLRERAGENRERTERKRVKKPEKPTVNTMDAPEDRDVKLQKVSGDLLTQFCQRLPELLQVEDGEGGRRRRNTVDSLIALVRKFSSFLYNIPVLIALCCTD